MQCVFELDLYPMQFYLRMQQDQQLKQRIYAITILLP